jgi:tetratricopeptide (TPR) repeat protein
LLKAAPKEAVEAAIFKAHLFICEEKYKQAKSLLDQNHQNVKKATENFFAADPIGENDYIAHILLELAFLAANQGDLQKALDTLKIIVEKYTDSVWCNDALSEALFITRTSVGDFSLHNKTRTARRLAARNETEKAVEIYDNLIKENASMTAFIKELEADKIVLLTKVKSEEESLGLIDDFIARYPEHFAGADLLELKLNIFRRQQASKDQIRELLQTFIDDFPNDLRTGRYKNLLEEEKYLLEMPEN